VCGIVEQSGGSIAVDSAVGRGTTFRLYFPTAEPVGAAGAGGPAA
jgi:signal transduction histidine kinase